jgi:multiple RNA-binding domain-containing protein 1
MAQYGDTTIPRAWSKYSKDSSAYEKKQENAEKIATNNSQAWRDQKKEGLKIDVEKDAKLQEFIVANKAKSKVWMNDDSAVATMSS